MFVGQQHQEILGALRSRWDDILGGDAQAPRMITLVGHQGVGKSRIIREFYRHVASGQTQPAYWPDEILPVELLDSRDPMPERKVLGPVVDVWPANALPDFFWWDFEGDLLLSGSASPALLAGEAKFRRHERAVWEAYLRRTGIWRRLGHTLRSQFRDLAADQIVEVCGRALGEIGVSAPGLGFAINRIANAFAFARQRQQARKDLQTDVELADGTADLGQELAASMIGLTDAVPLIVAIEDAHWAEPSLCGFLRVLATSRAKVLILATAWREGMTTGTQQHYFGALENELRTSGFAQRVEVQPPKPTERESLVQDLAGTRHWSMPGDVIAELARRYTTPLGISLAMSLGFMERFVRKGCPRDELDEMPRTLVELYKRRWKELDTDVRDILILAALLSPAGATEGRTADGRVSLDLIVRSLHALEEVVPVDVGALGDNAGVELAYEAALHDAAWLMEIARATAQFREPELAAIAMTEAHDRGLTRSDRNVVRQVYLGVLRAVLDDEGSQVRSLAAAHYLTLDPLLSDDEVPDDHYLGLAAILSAREYASAYQYREAVDVLLQVKDRVDPSTRMDVLRDLGDICLDATLWYEAAESYRELLALLGADLTVFSRETAGIVASLAECELERHRYSEVEALLGPIVETLPEDLDEVTIQLRRRHARAIRGDSKRLGEALVLLQSLLADIQAARSDARMWDIQEAHTRMALAIAHRRAGHHTEALSQLDEVIRLRTGIYGENARQTLTALNQKAVVLKETAGRQEEGRALVQEILERRLAAFGSPRHPQVLKSRHAAAFDHIADDPMAARDELLGVLTDKREVLGQYHLSTLVTLSALARACGEAGDLQESLRRYDELIELRREHGSVRDVLLARMKRLRMLRRVDCEAAVAEAAELVAACSEERGRLSVDNLRARFEQAETAAQCRSHEAGLALHRAVLMDRQRHLPADHTDIADSEAAVRRLEGEIERR